MSCRGYAEAKNKFLISYNAKNPNSYIQTQMIYKDIL